MAQVFGVERNHARSHFKRVFGTLGCLLLVLVATCGRIASADMASGVQWLATHAQPDGSFSSSTDLATPTQATSEALRALRALGEASQPGIPAAEQYLAAEPFHNTEYLARKIIAAAEGGQPTATWVAELLTHQSSFDGGFGDFAGFESTVLDTAWALEALSFAAASPTTTAQAVQYLLSAQLSNGGWGDASNGADVYRTALAMSSLRFYVSTFVGVGTALSGAQNFLLSQRAGDLWVEDHLSAWAVLALAPIVSDLSLIQSSAGALQARQLPDGSWAGDVYTSALALRAQRAVDARGSGITLTEGAITGTVIVSGSGQAVAGAHVALQDTSNISVTTSADGRFLITGLSAGTTSLSASKSGYTTTHAVAVVRSGLVTDVGQLVLSVAADSGLFNAYLFETDTGLAVGDAQILLSGPQTLSTRSDVNGHANFAELTPGDYNFSVQHPDYYSVSGIATITAGQAVELRQPLLRQGAFQDPSPITLSGRVVDADTGLALAGASFNLTGVGSVLSDSNGEFQLAGVAPGNYQASLSAVNYLSQFLALAIPPGAEGTLGEFRLFKADGPPAVTGVTLRGEVLSTLDQQPIAGITVELVDTLETTITDAQGQFTLASIPLLNFQLRLSGPNYQDATYEVSVSGFGEVYQAFLMTPGGDINATESSLTGTVTDKDSGDPIANASVSIPDLGLSTTTDTTGQYSINLINVLNFILDVQAPGYLQRQATVDLPAHGQFRLDIPLQAEPQPGSGPVQILDVSALQLSLPGTETALFHAQVKNLTVEPQDLLLIGKVYDVDGIEIATVAPYIDGTQITDSNRSFLPDETQTLTIPWDTQQFALGAYRLVLRAVVPGTIWPSTPLGEVIDEGSDSMQVTATSGFSGEFAASPPLLQAGSSTPAQLDALILNSGNIPMSAATMDLVIQDPSDGTILHNASVTVEALEVGNSQLVSFGSWLPSVVGELPVMIISSTVPGSIQGTLYVGDKATGEFSIEQDVVPEGTSIIASSITVNGVDVTQASSTDPLFFAVKEAIRKGGEYTAPSAVSWHQSNRCLGCHIQTQSMAGLASALNKAPTDLAAATYLYNALSSNLQANGTLRASHSSLPSTQTQLGLWSLGYWNDPAQSFRTRYKAAQYLYGRRINSGDTTFWRRDHNSGWWRSDEAATALVVQGISELLKDAPSLAAVDLDDYSLTTLGSYAYGGSHTDLEYGPDGWLYSVANRVLHRFHPVSGAAEVLDTNLPMSQAYGLAFAADGTLWISGTNGTVQRRDSGGGRSVFQFSSGILTDIEQGPDGMLYVSDYSNHRLWRVTPDGLGSIISSGGRLRNPYGLGFKPDGQLIIANLGGRNLLQLDVTSASPDVGIFAEGLSLEPIYLATDNAGGVYFSTNRYSNAGLNTAGALHYARSDGTIERLVTAGNYSNNRLFGVVVQAGSVWVSDLQANRLYQLQTSPLDTSLLPTLQAQLPRAVRFVLNRYQDNTSDNIRHAMRLTVLGEALPWLTDAVLRGQVEAAMTTIADLLRSRQRADGGWRWTTQSSSDPMVTALVGIALDYTNPSVNDPLVRNTIQYLLNTQLADGSWRSTNNILSTRLAATSLFVIYLPLALDRLGGLDVDLHLTLPTNITLSNPSLGATELSTTAEGLAHYFWELIGVTAAGRTIDFDLTMHDMQLNEVRDVATEAYLEFANSFVPDERLRSDLPIPQVRTAKDATVTVTTDKTQYGESEPVLISGVVSNVGPVAFTGEVVLSIWAIDGTAPIATPAPIPVVDLPVQSEVPYTLSWNTGNQLTGDYEVRALLYDSLGRLFDQADTLFEIIVAGPSITGTITTDKPVYGAWDIVQLSSRVHNTTSNAIQPPTVAEITVYDPAGVALATTPMYTHAVPELVAGALRDLLDSLNLVDAEAGTYTARLDVFDAFSHTLLASDATTFEVVRHLSQGITGTVTVDFPEVNQGDPNLCRETLNNLSATPVASITAYHRLVYLDSGEVVSGPTLWTESLPASGSSPEHMEAIDTSNLAAGDYACVLSIDGPDGTEITLDNAVFRVLEPPINIDLSVSQSGQGRVLILLDDAGHTCSGVESLSLEAQWTGALSENASVTVQLLDAQNTLLDEESTPVNTQAVDVNVGAGANLVITDSAPQHLAISVLPTTANNLLGAGYRIEATLSDGTTATPLSSTLIPTDCEPVLSIGEAWGDFTVTELTLRPAANDPLGPNHVPDLLTQRAYLETLLTDAGWSYTITTHAEDFTQELRSGEYLTYLLLSEHVKLDEPVQKELREAVYRGEGLIEAGSHDQRQGRIDEALGVIFRGKLSQVSGVELLESAVHPSGLTAFGLTDRQLRADLDTAESIGQFLDDSGVLTLNSAVTRADYGQGKSVYMGFDLLAEASLDGTLDNLYATLLLGALEHVYPTASTLPPSGVYPITLTLSNLGIATPGRVILELSSGVEMIDANGAALISPVNTPQSCGNGRLIWPKQRSKASRPGSNCPRVRTLSRPAWRAAKTLTGSSRRKQASPSALPPRPI